MHVAYWGLSRSPFTAQLNPADYYPSAVHEEALARLHFLVDSRRRLGYLLGGSGTGKSLVLDVAALQLRRRRGRGAACGGLGLQYWDSVFFCVAP